MFEMIKACLKSYNETGKATGRNKAMTQTQEWLAGYHQLTGQERTLITTSFNRGDKENCPHIAFNVREFGCKLQLTGTELCLVFTALSPDYLGLDGETVFVINDNLEDWQAIYTQLRDEIHKAWRKEAENLQYDPNKDKWQRPHTGYYASITGYGDDGWGFSVDNGKESIGSCNPFEVHRIASHFYEKREKTGFWLVNRSNSKPFWEFRCHYNVMYEVERRFEDGEDQFFSRCRKPEGLTYTIKETRTISDEVFIEKLYAKEIDTVFSRSVNSIDIWAVECFLKFENSGHIIKTVNDIK